MELFEKNVKKAIFPVAGFGTRFLPATKAMPKELLPIVDKPLVQYAAEEAIAAGIETLIFVTGRNKRAIEDHFDSSPELENALRSKGKENLACMVKNIVPKNVNCVFVRQSEQLGLGHAVLCARSVVEKEPFAVLLADDFIPSTGYNTTKELLKAFLKSGKSQLAAIEIDDAEVSKYGILEFDSSDNRVTGLVEKPSLPVAPSRKASIGRYVLSPEIFDILEELPPDSGGEIQLSTAIGKLAVISGVEAIELKGKRFDCGSVEGFISASNYEYNLRYSK